LEAKAHPLPGVELRIEAGGRIAVRGPMVSPGYLDEPDRERGSWFLTGDLGTLDLEGAVRVTGRADEIIVSGGENVDPAVVEDALADIPGVRRALVLGVPSAEWGMEVACAYEGDLEPADLEASLRERLGGALIPKRWLRMSRIPTTDLDKPDRGEVIRLFSQRVGR
jgi:O-succinylbenzoic acid--CoA ligase